MSEGKEQRVSERTLGDGLAASHWKESSVLGKMGIAE